MARDIEKKEKGLWQRVHVKWTFLSPVYASTPADPEIIKAWLDARKPAVKPPDARGIHEINEEVLSTLEKGDTEPAYGYLVFPREPGTAKKRPLVLRSETIRAHLKDCSRQVSRAVGRIKAEAAISTRIINGVYQEPRQYWLPLKRVDGTPITEHDTEIDRTVTTRFGTSIKRLQMLHPPVVVEFDLLLLKNVSVADLETVMSYGQVHGYGGERSRDGGRYEFEVKAR